MKIAATLAALIAMAGASFAASITVANFRSGDTNLVTDSSNELIPNGTGYVAIGVFNVDDPSFAPGPVPCRGEKSRMRSFNSRTTCP
jgi:hypothetical protein